MQLKLPLFPRDTLFISSSVGVYERDDMVQYIVNGLPVFSHHLNDYTAFRFITSNFIEQKLCLKSEVIRCFDVTAESVTKWHSVFVTHGADGFFSKDSRKGGRSHKLVGAKLEQIQAKLDTGLSNVRVAKEEGITESAIRYALKQGYLKKKL